MRYEQGQVVWVYFPFTDGSGAKTRPALIISNRHVNRTGDYLLMQITSRLRQDDLSLDIAQDVFDGPPLLKPTQLRLHKIFTLNDSLIVSRLSSVSPDFFAIIIRRLTNLFQPFG